jgi:hypothetical protein
MKASVLGLVLLVAACHPPTSGDTLGESVRTYNEGVRWERYEYAAAHIPPKERTQFLDDADMRAKDLHITSYDVVSVEKRSDKLAYVKVKMGWYLDSQGTVKETSSVQTWERHGKSWWVVEEHRLRGDEMPGMREPPTRESAAAESIPQQTAD